LRSVVLGLITVVLVVVQSTLISVINIYGVKPDIPLVFILCVSMIKGERTGAVIGFLNGLLEDILFGRFLGFNALVKSMSGYILGFASKNVYKGPAIITMFFVFMSSIMYNFIFMLFSFLIKEITNPWVYFLPITIPSAFLNMIISPFVYLGISKLEHFFDFYFDVKY